FRLNEAVTGPLPRRRPDWPLFAGKWPNPAPPPPAYGLPILRPVASPAGRRRESSPHLPGIGRGHERMLKVTTKQRLAKPYMWLVIGLGVVACAFTVVRLQPSELGWRFALVSVLTLGFGSRVVVQIPRVKGQISVSDTFIFLVLLLFGGEAAILIAAADAFFSSLRITKSGFIVAFNSAVYVCSTFLTVWALRLAFGDILSLARGDQSHYIV